MPGVKETSLNCIVDCSAFIEGEDSSNNIYGYNFKNPP